MIRVKHRLHALCRKFLAREGWWRFVWMVFALRPCGKEASSSGGTCTTESSSCLLLVILAWELRKLYRSFLTKKGMKKTWKMVHFFSAGLWQSHEPCNIDYHENWRHHKNWSFLCFCTLTLCALIRDLIKHSGTWNRVVFARETLWEFVGHTRRLVLNRPCEKKENGVTEETTLGTTRGCTRVKWKVFTAESYPRRSFWDPNSYVTIKWWRIIGIDLVKSYEQSRWTPKSCVRRELTVFVQFMRWHSHIWQCHRRCTHSASKVWYREFRRIWSVTSEGRSMVQVIFYLTDLG